MEPVLVETAVPLPAVAAAPPVAAVAVPAVVLAGVLPPKSLINCVNAVFNVESVLEFKPDPEVPETTWLLLRSLTRDCNAEMMPC